MAVGSPRIEDNDLRIRTKKRFRLLALVGIVGIVILGFLYVRSAFEQNRRDIEELRAMGITGPEPEVFCVLRFDKKEYQPGDTVYMAWETKNAEFVKFIDDRWPVVFVSDFSTSTQFATSGVIKLTLRENIEPHSEGYRYLYFRIPIRAVGIISQGPQKGEPKYAEKCEDRSPHALVVTPPLK